MKDIEIETSEFSTHYSWTIASFNKNTGNMCQEFTHNYHQAIDFLGEVEHDKK